jgi:hypothetical protein
MTKIGGRIRTPGYTEYKKGVTASQKINRKVFGDAVRCFKIQPYTGGVEPPEIGVRNRSWWYTAAGGSGLWYFNYFMKQTINELNVHGGADWCTLPGPEAWYTKENAPDQINSGYTATWAVESLDGDTQHVFFIKPPTMKRLHLFVYAWSRADVYEHPGEMIFQKRNDDWPEGGPTWNNYPGEGEEFLHIDGIVSMNWIEKWVVINVPNCKVVQIKTHSPDTEPEFPTTLAFVTGPWDDWPTNQPYWTA